MNVQDSSPERFELQTRAFTRFTSANVECAINCDSPSNEDLEQECRIGGLGVPP